MQPKLITLAVLALLSTAAAAQSSVTLFGVVDINLRNVSNSGFGHRTTVHTDGLNSNRIGFRGVEDLGGGLSARFWLEGGFSPDSGAAGAAGLTFQREAHLSLAGPWGQLRLGRDYTPTFWNTTAPFEPFGNNGVGSSVNIARFNGGSNWGGMGALQQPASLRASNSVAYWLPDNIGGFYGTAMAAAGEGAANGMYRGVRLGWRNATVNVAAAVGRQKMAAGAEYEVFNTALSWDFGALRLVGQYNNEELTTAPRQKEVRVLLGAIVPVGSGELKASIVRSDLKNSANDATQVALGYVHHLSRRTALYTTVSRISNKGAAAFSVTGGAAPGGAGNASPGGPTPGGRSTGAELGIRHFF